MQEEGAPGRRLRLLAGLAVAAAVTLTWLATVLAPTARPATPDAVCSSFGPTWAHTYNTRAVTAGNPVRILAACCQSTQMAGVHHCFVTVTLAGTIDRGCELVNIGPTGWPAGPGKHEKCVPRAQTA